MGQTVTEVEATGRRIVAAQADVRDYDALKAAVDDGAAQLGRLDIVVANAGIGNTAVVPATAGWPDTDRRMAAGMLDILRSVMSYERLVTAWELSPQQATRAITWVIGLIEAAIREGRPPGSVARS